MADNVLFCWRTTLQEPLLAEDGSEEYRRCVLIYIDRIGDESRRPAKRLYAIPLGEDHVLRISGHPSCTRSLPEVDYARHLNEFDQEKIRLITNKQGFENARL